MSTVQILSHSETVKPNNTLSNKPKAKDKERKPKSSQKSQAERLKTVIRRLPPNLPEDVFWQSVQPWVTDDTILWRAYYPGKLRKRLNKENVPSRAYIAFKSEELLANFSRGYDGHIFRDKAGNESIAVVEFSPFQKIPSEKKKVDSRMGTIEKGLQLVRGYTATSDNSLTDEDFISFLESLKEVQTKTFDVDTLEALVASTQPAPVPTTTPLLESLRAEKTAQKDKEAIQRNHAHYKDPTVVSGVPAVSTDGPSRKDDKKKKGPSIPLPTKPAEAPISKKASKRAAAKAAQQEVAKSTGGSGASNKAAQQASTAQSPSKSAPSSPNPKASRGHRERQASKSIPPPALVPTNPTETTANASSTSQVPTTAAAQPAPRRTRPVLGLGRQFEAALNGAGVAISPAERKARRERQREVSGSGAPGSEKSKVKEDARPANPVTRPSTSQAPPTILQRDPQAQPPQILSRPTPATDTATSAVPSQREDAPVERSRGRGHGRGRGRRGRGA